MHVAGGAAKGKPAAKPGAYGKPGVAQAQVRKDECSPALKRTI